jgi:uncharacterized metal-binding protein
MAENCGAGSSPAMILACSGASCPGRLSNQAAVELTLEGHGKMYCLAGIGAGLSGFVQSARDVTTLVVIDGCETACGRICLEKAGVRVEKHVVVSRLALATAGGDSPKPEDVTAVKYAVKLALGRPISVTFNSPRPLTPAEQALSKRLGGPCC